MKKILLLAIVAVAAMTANAQKLNVANYPMVKADKIASSQVLSMNQDMLKNSTVSSSIMKEEEAEESNGIVYIESKSDAITECNIARLTPGNYEIAYEDGSKDVFNVKVELSYMAGTKFGDIFMITAYGNIDEEAGTLTIPCQEIEDPTAGQAWGEVNVLLLGLESEDAENFDTKDLVFEKDESGAYYLTSHVAYYGYLDGKGWYVNGWNDALLPPNGEQAGYENSSRTNKKWGATSYPVFIEDYETTVNVYNFCGFGMATIDINEDGTVSIPTGQPIYDLDLDEAEAAIYGEYANIVAFEIEGNSLYRNWDVTEIKGHLVGNTIIIDDEAREGYFCLASNPDGEGAAYGVGNFTEQTITLTEGNFAAGIKDVTTSLENRIKNTKTYNLMGQQVNRDQTKGLLIRGGKKYIKK